MDEIQKRVDNEAWDKKVDRGISDINRAIEKGYERRSAGSATWFACAFG